MKNIPGKSNNNPSSRGEVVAAMSFVYFATAVLFGVFALLTEGMAESLQVPDSQRGTLFGISGIGATSGWLLASVMLRWMTRKRILIAVLALECCAIAVLSSTSSWAVALFALFTAGLAQCCAMSAGLAAVIDVEPKSSVGNINLVMSSNLVFPIAAWVLGALLALGISWRSAAWMMIVPLMVAIVWIFRLRLPHAPDKRQDGSTALQGILSLSALTLSRPLLIVFVMSGFILGIVPGAWITLFAQSVFNDRSLATMATSFTLLGIGLGQLFAGSFTLRNPVRLPLAIIATILAVSYMSLFVTVKPWNCWLVSIASGLLGGMMLPTTLAVAQRNLGRTASDGIAVLGACGEISAAVSVYLLGVASTIFSFSTAFALLAIFAGVIVIVCLTGKEIFGEGVNEEGSLPEREDFRKYAESHIFLGSGSGDDNA